MKASAAASRGIIESQAVRIRARGPVRVAYSESTGCTGHCCHNSVPQTELGSWAGAASRQ